MSSAEDQSTSTDSNSLDSNPADSNPPPAAPVEITFLPSDVDEDGFISIWNVAATSCGNDTVAARQLAASLLCFLCKKKCDFVVTSSSNAEYLTDWFERDNKLLYDWKPESEFVDIVAQHAEVPADTLLLFLKNKKFDPAAKYTATRASRVEWFEQQWCTG
ncbi:hypothetical protein SH139x_000053 [Planctomycetaceae bacterium SH139]